jgi:HD-like signal output (HDOD) protein
MPTPAAGGTFDVEAALVALVAKDQVKVPPYPAVALKLGDLVRRENYGLKEVVSLVSADPSLAAEVIRCSNSAYYGRGEVTSLQPAISRVGANEVVRLAVVSGLSAAVRTPGPLQEIKRQAWQDAVASAIVCQVLARCRGLAPDDAFLCGLLHDFGWMLGLRSIEDILAQRPQTEARSVEEWRALVDKLHVELGVVLAARWNLPAVLSDVITLHHEADPTQSPHEAMIEVVQASDQVVALFAQKPHLSGEDLALASKLRQSERAKLAASLPDVPTVIAAFEQEPTGRPMASKVLPEAGEQPPDEVPSDLLVKLHSPKRASAYRLVQLGPGSWTMTGKEPLSTGTLLEVEIGDGDQRLRLWAKADVSAAESGGARVRCRPFLMNAAVLQRWLALYQVAQTAQGGAAPG